MIKNAAPHDNPFSRDALLANKGKIVYIRLNNGVGGRGKITNCSFHALTLFDRYAIAFKLDEIVSLWYEDDADDLDLAPVI